MDDFEGEQEEEDANNDITKIETEVALNTLQEVKFKKSQRNQNSRDQISIDLLSLFQIQLFSNPKGEIPIPEMKPQSSILDDETDFRLDKKLD